MSSNRIFRGKKEKIIIIEGSNSKKRFLNSNASSAFGIEKDLVIDNQANDGSNPITRKNSCEKLPPKISQDQIKRMQCL